MSTVDRYDLNSLHAIPMIEEAPLGDYVLYDDYRRARSETYVLLEHLKKAVIKIPQLEAENERLKKRVKALEFFDKLHNNG